MMVIMYTEARDSEAKTGEPFVTEQYLEDFRAGQTFRSGRIRIDANRIKSFAAEFDPQPFHLDERAATDSIFGGLAASGWHTAAITMRLLVDSDLKPAGGIVSAGFDEFRWPRPVRPGDELRVEGEVLEIRASKSRPDQGVIKVRATTINQNNEPVQVSLGHLIVRCRLASSGEGHAQPHRKDRARDGRLVENRRSHGAARVGNSALMKQRSKCNSR